MAENLLQQKIEALLNQIIGENNDVFVVDIKINAGNNIGVFLDADDGLTIDKCTKINRSLYHKIEEEELFPDNNFGLEVSSPGVDEPLKLERQYKKNVGRTVEVTGIDEQMTSGKLAGLSPEGIILEQQDGKGKKTVLNSKTILFNQIKHIKVLVTF